MKSKDVFLKKIFRRENISDIIIAVLVILMLGSVFSVLIPSFSRDDRNISANREHGLNDGWTCINDNTENIELPFTYEPDDEGSPLILENSLSERYGGLSVVVRLRNAALRVYLGDGEEYITYYEKGLMPGSRNDGAEVTAVGSTENIIELPAEVTWSRIRLEVIPVAKNAAVAVENVDITRYESLIVSLLESSLFIFGCCILIIVCCVIMFITDTIRVFSGWGKWELPLLIFFGMTCVAYMVTRLSLFEAVLGNAHFFDFAATFALANMLPILIAHFSRQSDLKSRKGFKYAIVVFMVIAFVFDLLFAANTEMREVIKAASIILLSLLILAEVILLLYFGVKEKNRTKIFRAVAYGILLAGFALNAAEIFGDMSDSSFDNIQMCCTTVFFAAITAETVISVIAEYKARSRKAEKEAIAANEAKSNFLSSMSHEIRTPINAVLGMNEMILRECGDENILGYAESIRTAGSTLLGLVNDILDFSKIEAGKLDIICVDYDLSSVLNDLVNMIHIKAEAKGLELNMNIAPDIPKLLHGDDIRFRQIVTNILTNAVKYTEKGSVTLNMGYERIPDDDGAVVLKVSIADTGIGIKKEDMPKLFGEFERIEELRNRSIEGTGLGMSITRRLLTLMNSTLEVESEYGKGSVFTFARRQDVVEWEPLGDYVEAFRRSLTERKRYRERFVAPDARILVIDDNAMNLSVFKNLLKQTKMQVDEADSGDSGIACADRNLYDIIFIDHMMPDKDGIETLGEIRAKQGLNSKTTAVCLTANAVAGAREKYLEAGFDDYLTKPIDPSRLERMIMGYLPDDKVIAVDKDDEEESPEMTEAEMIEVLPEWLKDIDEIDVKAGLERCKDVDSYLDAVRIYESLVNTNADEIEGYIEAADTVNATIKIHALKSTSRVIGAESLGALAEKLEAAGKADDTGTLYAGVEELLTRYRKLGGELKRAAGADSAEGSELKPLDEEMLNEMLSAVREFMSVSDYDSAVEIIGELKGYSIPENERERCGKLIAAAEEIRYEDIERLLK